MDISQNIGSASSRQYNLNVGSVKVSSFLPARSPTNWNQETLLLPCLEYYPEPLSMTPSFLSF
jgi:hypothetical protein